MGEIPNKKSRRSVLKKGGVAALGLATVGGTAVASDSEKVSAEEAGVDKAAEKLAEQQKLVELFKLLRNHNVEYGASLTTRSGKRYENPLKVLSGQETSSGDVTTQDFFTKSDSYVTSYHWNRSGDLYHIQSDVTLQAFDGVDVDLAAPNDAFTLAYGDNFQFEPDTIMYDGPDGGSAISVREYPITSGKGLVLDVNDRDFAVTSQDTYTAYLGFDVNKTTTGQANYAGQYDHTWSIGDLGLVTGTLDFTWEALGISLDLSNLVVDGYKLYDAEEIN